MKHWEQHLLKLREVLTRLQGAQLTIKLGPKTTFSRATGHTWDTRGDKAKYDQNGQHLRPLGVPCPYYSEGPTGLSGKFTNQRLLRWSLFLQPYNLTIIHIKGTDNIIADALLALEAHLDQFNSTTPLLPSLGSSMGGESCKQCELDGDVDEELEKNLHSWTQLDVQDNVPLSPDMFPMEHRQIWVDLFIRYNTPVPSSAAVERLFSMGSDVMRPKRSSLTAKNFEKLVFLKGNMNLLKGRWELEDSDEED
ncbi:hypothetical protein GWK47_053699 [Chionoecetes opilio]|uniref:HAT C-terminal dimerisation domain-containing protein n=1 Tax=Chionoecetes opilio TaxID=41210 RepID=A0A8J4XYY7_CHIOP|nr:hypothetical protein GWK47_053699 [Chionoecetes opilio]